MKLAIEPDTRVTPSGQPLQHSGARASQPEESQHGHEKSTADIDRVWVTNRDRWPRKHDEPCRCRERRGPENQPPHATYRPLRCSGYGGHRD